MLSKVAVVLFVVISSQCVPTAHADEGEPGCWPTDTPAPTNTPVPTNTPLPTMTPAPTSTPLPTLFLPPPTLTPTPFQPTDLPLPTSTEVLIITVTKVHTVTTPTPTDIPIPTPTALWTPVWTPHYTPALTPVIGTPATSVPDNPTSPPRWTPNPPVKTPIIFLPDTGILELDGPTVSQAQYDYMWWMAVLVGLLAVLLFLGFAFTVVVLSRRN
jgi:hypothetical protein